MYGVECAVLTVGGWSRWDGSSLGRVQFASKTGEFWREQMQQRELYLHARSEQVHCLDGV